MASTIAVRALCEFTARQGDLDLRFTPAPTAQEGIAGHQWVQARRGAAYEAEVALQTTVGTLTLRGRADGFDPERGRLEEIKTHKGDLARQPAHHRHLHWAQAKVYAALMCRARALPSIEVALVYLDVSTQRETVLVETHSAEALEAFLHTQCERYRQWAEQEAAHREARDQALRTRAFPMAEFRAGQRPLAEAVFRAARHGRTLLAEAPTGLGKSIGTVFPLLKAMPEQALDKLYFLSAKSSGRGQAWQALALIDDDPNAASTGGPGPWRSLELIARDKACEYPDRACHGESCPLARGFYDRLPAARLAAVQARRLTRDTLRQTALAHEICPYYLAQEMVRWVDVVVADYNHYFDPYAQLYHHVLAHEWRVGVLVDEAHNLVDRGRQMYSADLSPLALKSAIVSLKHLPQQANVTTPKALLTALRRLQKCWPPAGNDTEVLPALPDTWFQAVQRASAALGDHLSDHPEQPWPALQSFYLEALHFTRLGESMGQEALVVNDPHQGVGIRNVLPAPHLRPRWQAAHTATLFSATLQPMAYVQAMLGLPDDTVNLSVPSPFQAAQLNVEVAQHLSTRYADRQRSLPGLVRLMAHHYRERPGNHLAFFSSHAYLQTVADALALAHPDIPQWRQARGMSEAEQQAFLSRFEPQGQGIGFAVLGGSFGEGIDLPGSRLIGVFIATLGLPQVNPVQEALRERLDALVDRQVGSGHDCAYLYPGLQKVVQAAGRLIRTPDDHGIIVLMDQRYRQARVRALLPGWWPALETAPSPEDR